MGTSRIAGLVAEGAGALLRNIVVVIVNVIIMLFALWFFFRDGDAIMTQAAARAAVRSHRSARAASAKQRS